MYYKFEMATRQKRRKWLYVNYEEILKNLIRIYAEQEGIKVEINIDRRWIQMKNKILKEIYELTMSALIGATVGIFFLYWAIR